jgi:hypothetical protein
MQKANAGLARPSIGLGQQCHLMAALQWCVGDESLWVVAWHDCWYDANAASASATPFVLFMIIPETWSLVNGFL